MIPRRLSLKKVLALLAALLVWSVALQAANSKPATQSITFNHLTSDFATPPSLKLRNGDVFQIKIAQTYLPEFEYVVAGIPAKKSADTNEAGLTSIEASSLEDKSFWVLHDKKYSGYIVKIKRADGTKTGLPVTRNNVTVGSLQPLEFSVKVETMEWAYGVAGAFTASELTDPKFSLVENDKEEKIVTNDEDAEDSARLGLGAFLHLYHTRVPQIGITFGLGINEGNRTTYFVGPSWRFGDQGALTVGYALGSIDRLPNGLSEGAIAKDDNVLSNLPTRTVGRLFVALSYSFLDVGLDRLKKPFAGTGDSTTTVTTSDDSDDDQSPPPAPNQNNNSGGTVGNQNNNNQNNNGGGGTTSNQNNNQNNNGGNQNNDNNAKPPAH